MFVCKYADYISRGRNFTFRQVLCVYRYTHTNTCIIIYVSIINASLFLFLESYAVFQESYDLGDPQPKAATVGALGMSYWLNQIDQSTGSPFVCPFCSFLETYRFILACCKIPPNFSNRQWIAGSRLGLFALITNPYSTNPNTRSANMSKHWTGVWIDLSRWKASLAFAVRLESFSFQECSLIAPYWLFCEPFPTHWSSSWCSLV